MKNKKPNEAQVSSGKPHIVAEELDMESMPELKSFARGVRGPYLQSVKLLRERRARDREQAAKTERK
jgi:hypothetical protein